MFVVSCDSYFFDALLVLVLFCSWKVHSLRRAIQIHICSGHSFPVESLLVFLLVNLSINIYVLGAKFMMRRNQSKP